MLADLVGDGTAYEIARGGRGGRGNAALANTRRRAPGFAELGEPGESLDVVLELKSVADVGLVGFPSAGKSSLIAVLSAARPKIADYPFTTLVPNLGVVQAGDDSFVVADVPGLIPGAATGKGLGLEFLRHIERCAVLAHVVDCATLEPGRDPVSDIAAIEAELTAYGGSTDAPGRRAQQDRRTGRAGPGRHRAGRRGAARLAGVRGERGEPRRAAGADATRWPRSWPEHRAQTPAAEPTRIVLRPRAVDDAGFTIEPSTTARSWCAGRKPSAGCARPTSTTRRRSATWPTGWPGSVIEEQLAKKGAEPGCLVRIGTYEFEWQPAIYAGGEFTPGQRGTDYRLEDTSTGRPRPSAWPPARPAGCAPRRGRLRSLRSRAWGPDARFLVLRPSRPHDPQADRRSTARTHRGAA